ncbi:MAG: thioredoxin family protein, partial [Alphaproteobacteria bacterium]|nr:thioredoxin family protein [Alphaproteobacteria bacterium]
KANERGGSGSLLVTSMARASVGTPPHYGLDQRDCWELASTGANGNGSFLCGCHESKSKQMNAVEVAAYWLHPWRGRRLARVLIMVTVAFVAFVFAAGGHLPSARGQSSASGVYGLTTIPAGEASLITGASVTLLAAPSDRAEGRSTSYRFAVAIDLRAPWKTYHKFPSGVRSGGDAARPTAGLAPILRWPLESPVTPLPTGQETGMEGEAGWDGASPSLLFPAPKQIDFFGVTVHGYDMPVVLPFAVRIPQAVLEHSPSDPTFTMLICNDVQCIPETYALDVPKTLAMVSPTTTRRVSAAHDRALSDELAAIKQQRDAVAGEDASETGKDRNAAAPTSENAGDLGEAAKQDRQSPTPAAVLSFSFWAIVFVAWLGGLILNIMPCVLPVLTLKVSRLLVGAGVSRAEVRRQFLASSLGVVTSFAVLSLGLSAVRALGGSVGWGVQFQSPLFLGIMTVVMVLFGLNMLGLWRIAGFGMRLPVRLSPFLEGALMAVLSTPCSAPFVGVAVGFALASSFPVQHGILLAMGFGLATPLLAVAAFPLAVRWLPRPGRWMGRLRVILGVLLLASAVWIAVLFVEAARFRGASDGVSFGTTGLEIEGRVASDKAGLPSYIAGNRPWRHFDPALIEAMAQSGRVVLVDITAGWCLSCKFNDARVFTSSFFARHPNVVFMRGDWTHPSPVIADYIRDHGRFGIPLTVVYAPITSADGTVGVSVVVLPEFLFADTVATALAGGNREH